MPLTPELTIICLRTLFSTGHITLRRLNHAADEPKSSCPRYQVGEHKDDRELKGEHIIFRLLMFLAQKSCITFAVLSQFIS
jgi:hypothetical protein